MKRKFSRLEMVLVGIVLITVIGFLVSKFPNALVSKEDLLKKRYLQYSDLLEKGERSEMYKFLSSSSKNKMTLGEFVGDYKQSQTNEKRTITINSIVIKDNVGIIDRTNTCGENECTGTDVRGYKKWVYENGNWYYEPLSDPFCIREKMYDIPPEFKRALSLFDQRMYTKHKYLYNEIFNCLNIQYAELEDAEGIFTFDNSSSSLEDLKIYIDNSFSNKDDLLTAYLLAHEVNHALNYDRKVIYGQNTSCYDLEIAAYESQLEFIGSLNEQEQDSLVARIYSMDYSNNSPLTSIKNMLDFSGIASRYCGNNSPECYSKKMSEQISNMVRRSPYYQKQCSVK